VGQSLLWSIAGRCGRLPARSTIEAPAGQVAPQHNGPPAALRTDLGRLPFRSAWDSARRDPLTDPDLKRVAPHAKEGGKIIAHSSNPCPARSCHSPRITTSPKKGTCDDYRPLLFQDHPPSPPQVRCGAARPCWASFRPPAPEAMTTRRGRKNWVASWATSPAAYFVYVAALPQNQALAPSPPGSPLPTSSPTSPFPSPTRTPPGEDPDHSLHRQARPVGNTMRVRFSNVFGNQPLTFDSATIGLQEYAANVVHAPSPR